MRIAVKTFGCKVNQYESQLLRENLEVQGYALVDVPEADMVVVNTCCVTEKAEKEAGYFIRKYIADGKRVLVTGCAVRKQGHFLDKPTSSLEVYQDVDTLIRSICAVPFHTISRFDWHTRAFVKVEDGCENFCAYCIVPLVRGHVKSCPEQEIITEVSQLVENGYKEVVLTGIDLGAYGRGTDRNLISLIEKISSIKGLKRIRLSSIEVFHISEELVEYLFSNKLFCRHLHIPLQSGSDRILRRMGRRYLFSDYLNVIEGIRKRDRTGRVTFTTDIMVGFPGENEQDFMMTCEAIRRVGYLRVHIFRYSKREGTPACIMSGQVSERIKKERERYLERIAGEVCYNIKKGFIGKPLEVLVENVFGEPCSPKGGEGYSSEYIPVRFTGGQNLLNKIITVTGRELDGDYLAGEVA